MSYFDRWYRRYPATDFSQINLDWIGDLVKDLASEVDSLDELYTELKNSIADIKNNIDQSVADYLSSVLTDAYLEQIVTSVIGANSKITFVSSGDSTDNTTRLSLCTIISTLDHAVLFDTGNDSAATKLLAALSDLGITTIDAVIISHWHADHISGLTGLTSSNYDFSGTKLYAPHSALDVSLWQGDTTAITAYKAIENTWVTWFTANADGVVYPTESTTVSINGVAYTFHNLAAAKFTDYYSYKLGQNLTDIGETNYNNFSMGLRGSAGGHSFALASDFMPPACEKNTDLIAGAQLVQIEHHGANVSAPANWLNSMGADLFVVADYSDGKQTGLAVGFPTIMRALNTGALYDTKDNNCVFKFGSLGITVVSGDIVECTPDLNPLGMCQMMPDGADWDDYTTPGAYSVLNNTRLQTMSNYPPEFSSGCKLYVIGMTASGYPEQLAVAGNRVAGFMAIRNWDTANSVYYDWHYIEFFARKQKQTLTSAADITIYTANDFSRYEVINGYLFISFSFQATSTLTASTTLFTIPYVINGTTVFSAVTTTGDAVPMRVDLGSGNCTVSNITAISSGTYVQGSVMIPISPTAN